MDLDVMVVVSSGHFHAFYVIFFPLEYMSPPPAILTGFLISRILYFISIGSILNTRRIAWNKSLRAQ